MRRDPLALEYKLRLYHPALLWLAERGKIPEIRARNRRDGGAEFEVDLPLAVAPAVDAGGPGGPPAPVADPVVEPVKEGGREAGVLPAASPPPSAKATAAGAPR